MDRYQRVEKPREETPINENEIRITAQGRMRSYISYGTNLLQEKGSNEIVFKAMGRAINKTVMIVELIKRRIVGLHQNTEIGSTDIIDTWEPLEEGLLPLETTRHVSMITITLSKEELDASSPGYQLPIPKDQVKPLAEFEFEGEDLPGGRGRGRGGYSRGRSRGNGFMAPDYNEGWDNRGYGRGGWNRGRGRGFRGRGRGGYGGRSYYQQENGGYDEEYSVPVQGQDLSSTQERLTQGATATAGRWVVSDRPNLSPSDDEDKDTVSEGEDKNTSSSSITNPKCFSVAEALVKEEKEESEDDECSILAFNPFDSLTANFNGSHESDLGAEEEVVVLAERGKVACKDYPHSRHHCGEYPFDKTPHERFCAKCYCYVCDEVAPCLFWEANSSGHCHASDKEDKWKDLRLWTRNFLQNREQNLPTQANSS